MGSTICETHEVEQFLGALLGLTMRHACDICRNHDILDGSELRQQLMKLEHESQMLITEV